MIALLLFAACPAPVTTDTSSSAHPDTSIDDTAVDTGEASDSGDSVDSGDSGESAVAPITANYVLISFTVANRGEGFDLDGDSEIDNALWPLGSVLDPLIVEAQAVAQHVAIAQASDIDSFSADNSIRVGLLTVVDEDGDGSDNGSGTESFDGGALVDANGVVVIGTETPLTSGAYQVELATGTLPVGSYEFELATGLFIDAALDAGSQSGMLGFGISIEALELALVAEDVSAEVIAAMTALADLDLDGDGVADAVSMAFTFEAVICTVTAS